MSLPSPPSNRPLRIGVVGAGAIGLACAFELRRRGADVVVYDRGSELGGGATMRAAGMLGAAYEGAADEESPALFALMQASAQAWPDLVREIERLGGGPVEYSTHGALACALDADDEARLATLARACQARGLAAEMLSGDAARSIEPSLSGRVISALHLPHDRQVDAQMLLMRTGQALSRLGVGLRLARPVERIIVGDGLAGPDGDRFDRIVLATGAGQAVQFGDRRGQAIATGLPELVPVKGQMLALAPPAGAPRHVLRGRDVYLAPKSRWILVGATVERGRADTTVDRDVIERLRERAAMLVPGLAATAELAAWAGVRPGSDDGLPLIGPTAIPGVIAALGHYRNGVLLAPGTASLVADIVLDGKVSPAPAAFNPLRFDNRAAAPHSR